MTENRHVVARGGEREWRVNGASRVLQGEATILYIDFDGGYMTVCNYQNSSGNTLKIIDDTLINGKVATLSPKKEQKAKMAD